MFRPCIIASHKSWNSQLASRLSARTNREFIFIHDRHHLTESKLNLLKPEYVFFPHWSYKISREIWQNYESIIFHMTDVPYGRGGSPLQNLIVRGHQTTMISALRCVEKLDAGPVYLKKPLTLAGSAEDIFYRADQIIEEMIVEIITSKPIPYEQSGEVVFFARRAQEESNLDNSASLNEAYNMIRMLDAEGYPHAFFETRHLKFEFRNAKLIENKLEATVFIHELDGETL